MTHTKRPLLAQKLVCPETPCRPTEATIAGTPATPTPSSLSSSALSSAQTVSSGSSEVIIQHRDLEKRETERPLAVRRYISKDPEEYGSSISNLTKLKTELINQISHAVRGLLEASDQNNPATLMEAPSMVHRKAHPKIFKALAGKPFLELAMRLCGTGSAEQIYRRVAKVQMNLDDFLRAIIGTATCEWVLEESYMHLSRYFGTKTEISRIYERCIAEGKFSSCK